ncbi:hypothetical protein L6452_32766 [Arctium lappa]|uniref:Uncharacterized protein n=1 Tax=Arctium lappa TaxID=4217 RepID=A0ACB8Z659_ARCLA|nr:hypothetical protein L6452_32766 [Arctium lappa]
MASSTSSSSKAPKKNMLPTPPTSLTDLVFNPCNHVARLECDPKYKEFNPISSFLQKSPLRFALTKNPPKMSKMLIGNFWLTCVYDATTNKVSASILSEPTSPDITFGVEDVRRALALPSYDCYDAFPLGTEHDEVVAALNYIHGENDRGRRTLLRRHMGGIWNFFFSHITFCLSKKTGGHDQCPSYLTQLAHAIMFQRKIDYAQYFFHELISVITPPKRPHVAYPRFIWPIINNLLADAIETDHRVVYDYHSPLVTRPLLKRGPLATDNPLLPGMVSFINSPDLQWGDAKDTPVSKGPSSVVDPSSLSLVTPASTHSSQATGTAALAQMTIPPKGPSVVTQVNLHTSKRRNSTSSPPSSPKRKRKVSRANPHTPPTDSSKSAGVEIVPSGPGESATPTTTSSVSSPKDACETFGDPHLPSSPSSFGDEDDLVFSPDQGSDFSLHGLSPDHFMVDTCARPSETLVLPKASIEGISRYLAYLQQGQGQDKVTTQAGPSTSAYRSPPHSPESSSSPMATSADSSSSDDFSSSPRSPATDDLLQSNAYYEEPSRTLPLPHHPPTPSRCQASAAAARDTPPVPVIPPEILADIQEANKQHRLIGAQLREHQNVLGSLVKVTCEKLLSLETSVAALQAASDARDAQVRRLQAASQAHSAISTQILQSLLSLHQRLDSFLVVPPTTAEGEKQLVVQVSSDSGRQGPTPVVSTDAPTEGERLPRQGIDKGKKKLSADEEAMLSQQQKASAIKAFVCEADWLKLQPPSKVDIQQVVELDSDDILWYRKSLMERKLKSKIVEVKFGTSKRSEIDIRIVIRREDDSQQATKFCDLDDYGLSEWYEISELLSKSLSRHKPSVKRSLNTLLEKMKNIGKKYKHSHDEEVQVEILKQMCLSSPPQISHSDKQHIFKDLAAKGMTPNSQNLNLKIPGGPSLGPGTVTGRPYKGVYFLDETETKRFFRHEEVSIAHTEFLVAILSLIPVNSQAAFLRHDIMGELHKRQKKE